MYPKSLETADKAYFLESTYFKQKFNFVHAYMHADCRYKMHSHQFYEINIIAKGQGRHYIENTSMPTKAGDVFVIPPEVKHGFFSDHPLDIYIILIKSDFMKRYAEELSALEEFTILFDIEPQIRCASGKKYGLSFGYKEFDLFEAQIKELIFAEKQSQFIYQNALLLSLICRLCAKIGGQQLKSGNKKEILNVMQYIKANLDQKLTLNEIAKIANMSKATLNRHFKTTVGLSPMIYILKTRVSKALELLSEGKVSKTEIAQMCGFYDVSHMNKYLYPSTSLAPLESTK
jgi:AraC-like DNA-binding protein/quercetin dioxygenase-like cupin family protein